MIDGKHYPRRRQIERAVMLNPAGAIRRQRKDVKTNDRLQGVSLLPE